MSSKKLKDDNGLSVKDNLFVREYCIDFNGTQAVLRCGFTDNYDSARSLAHRYLTNVDILEAIKKYREAKVTPESKIDIQTLVSMSRVTRRTKAKAIISVRITVR